VNLLLPVLLVFPLAGALVMYPLRRNVPVAKAAAMTTALLEFVLVVVTWVGYSTDAASSGERFQYVFSVAWLPA